MYLHSFAFASLIILTTAQISEIRDGENYKIRNVANGKYLTVSEQGIVGLRTGIVSTSPLRNSLSQSWTLTWEPLRNKYQGYLIQNRAEYLNAVTSFYYPNNSFAHINVWQLKFIGDEKWQIRNARTGFCLQLSENDRTVNEGKCLPAKDASISKQRWNLNRVIVVPIEDDI